MRISRRAFSLGLLGAPLLSLIRPTPPPALHPEAAEAEEFQQTLRANFQERGRALYRPTLKACFVDEQLTHRTFFRFATADREYGVVAWGQRAVEVSKNLAPGMEMEIVGILTTEQVGGKNFNYVLLQACKLI